jgi:hypothetical protein
VPRGVKPDALPDLWIVCAAWDLTEVERTVLAGRINA